jgi:hypothetical protein
VFIGEPPLLKVIEGLLSDGVLSATEMEEFVLADIAARKRQDWSEARINILSPHYADHSLEVFRQALNSAHTRYPMENARGDLEFKTIETIEFRDELRRLFHAWLASGTNLLQLFKDQPEVQESCMRGKTILSPTRDGDPQLAWLPDVSARLKTGAKRNAMVWFAQFLINPLAKKMAGPCARCGEYYIKSTVRQKVYCSKDCGTRQTGASATQRRRDRERVALIGAVQKVIDPYGDARRRQDWRVWTCEKTGVSQKWLSRALNKGELHPPLSRLPN